MKRLESSEELKALTDSATYLKRIHEQLKPIKTIAEISLLLIIFGFILGCLGLVTVFIGL